MTTTTCSVCQSWLGLIRHHDEKDCNVRASAWCSQCGNYGHRSIDCKDQLTWRRPETLEELIPVDVRERWDIDTTTPIVWLLRPSLTDAEREIADLNTIEIRYHDKLDAKIREVMKQNRIPTVHKMDGNIQKLREWAVSQGKKIRIVQEK